jgi:phosphoglycolate phosphatase
LVRALRGRLVLFDIDGTLVLTGGAGLRALTRAGEEVLGVPDLVDGIPVAGRTDWAILQDVAVRAGRDLDGPLLGSLREAYLGFLREEIERPGHGLKTVMPGIRELLAALELRRNVIVGLLTGNFAEGARIKLEHFQLWHHFRCGAYGDDHPDRNALVPFAVRRADARGLGRVPYDEVIVVGDTPHDVACARAVGAQAVAVATGSCSVEDLRRSGADVVLPDLSDIEALLGLMDG